MKKIIASKLVIEVNKDIPVVAYRDIQLYTNKNYSGG
jgi:hypothetical protein